ncbi:MAG: 5-dehydro-2-deoxygluconokinase [Actinomycetales bacterium mxb001]|nr:MAG: 5-dehydro-2-deoxygluconokinase [Actinomycetales bacterium mxb001]
MSAIPEVVTVGRISVDLYAQQIGASFRDPQTFTKSVGGSPTNVAIAAARLGHHAAVATKVGTEALGDYVREQLRDWGVDTTFVGTGEGLTPVVLAALDPPEDPPIIFYRGAAAPDTQLTTHDVPAAVIRECPVLWISFGALAQGSTADTCQDWLDLRERRDHVVLDLDYRPALWPDREAAHAVALAAVRRSTVVVGNRTECEVAVGETDPDRAADALLAEGVRLAIVKKGGEGVLLATADDRWTVPPVPIDVLCGLGAGDAFGGALIHGLLSGWTVPEIGMFANAAGAYVATQLTCGDAMPTIEQVEGLMEGNR